ncbi:hypothetical protein Tco_0031279 [Tanacetum coccineum]
MTTEYKHPRGVILQTACTLFVYKEPNAPCWRKRQGDGDVDDDGGFGGEAVGVTGWRWWRQCNGLWWRVVARELVGRIDPEMRIILGVGRKNSPENYSGGRRAAAAWWLAGGGGRPVGVYERGGREL